MTLRRNKPPREHQGQAPIPQHFSKPLLPLDQVFIKIDDGPLQGTIVTTSEGVSVRAFLGIPFGESTEGRNRFRKPVPIGAWNGTFNATQARPPCVQESYVSQAMRIDNTNTTEDCLHLNIWAPIQQHPKEPKKTVMVYFYGGSFTHGGNSYFFYDGRYISSIGDVILVVPNYRLGVLGFLNAGTPDAPGNVALHDQILALSWVKENIAAFGGNPNRVVLFGQSAGAISVSYLQISPLTRHLFRRAILQSCSALVPLPENSRDAALANLKHIASAINCTRAFPNGSLSAADTLSCLRNVDAKVLVDVKGAFFYPSFYDEVLPQAPIELLKSVDFRDHEMLIGNTLREGDMFFDAIFGRKRSSAAPRRSHLSLEAIAKAYDFFYKRTGFVKALFTLAQIQRLYDFTSRTYEGFKDAVGDLLFNCPTKFFAKYFVDQNGSAFYYVLTPRPSFSAWNSTAATHTDDVSILFGLPFMLPGKASDAERDLSRRLIRMWTTFAKKGKLPKVKGKAWPLYFENTSVAINTANFSFLQAFRSRNCETLKSFILG
ncbi:acetylcholinesterase-1-like [Dermacentor andersoni]|uniref:acetylcholinesterase-1-like n=1 Tax=Dermacentor andersoni TaxID=34620 RepID=UPI00241630FB|nr:acetylcholinesterase-like [Dermacentor andersoni]